MKASNRAFMYDFAIVLAIAICVVLAVFVVFGVISEGQLFAVFGIAVSIFNGAVAALARLNVPTREQLTLPFEDEGV